MDRVESVIDGAWITIDYQRDNRQHTGKRLYITTDAFILAEGDDARLDVAFVHQKPA